jgi:hypothetical protein
MHLSLPLSNCFSPDLTNRTGQQFSRLPLGMPALKFFLAQAAEESPFGDRVLHRGTIPAWPGILSAELHRLS